MVTLHLIVIAQKICLQGVCMYGPAGMSPHNRCTSLLLPPCWTCFPNLSHASSSCRYISYPSEEGLGIINISDPSRWSVKYWQIPALGRHLFAIADILKILRSKSSFSMGLGHYSGCSCAFNFPGILHGSGHLTYMAHDNCV